MSCPPVLFAFATQLVIDHTCPYILLVLSLNAAISVRPLLALVNLVLIAKWFYCLISNQFINNDFTHFGMSFWCITRSACLMLLWTLSCRSVRLPSCWQWVAMIFSVFLCMEDGTKEVALENGSYCCNELSHISLLIAKLLYIISYWLINHTRHCYNRFNILWSSF